MTGMGRDGTDGCRQLKEAGGFVFAQHQEDCVVYGMPKIAAQMGAVEDVLDIGDIAGTISQSIGGTSLSSRIPREGVM